MLPKDHWNHSRARATNHHKAYRIVRRSPGNYKTAKTEMVWARGKIGRPNQSDTAGNIRRQAEKGQAEIELDKQQCGVDRQQCGVDQQIIRRDSSYGKLPEGVERTDEEIRHDVPTLLLAELRNQGKRHGKANLKEDRRPVDTTSMAPIPLRCYVQTTSI